jgi:hypothetical protein
VELSPEKTWFTVAGWCWMPGKQRSIFYFRGISVFFFVFLENYPKLGTCIFWLRRDICGETSSKGWWRWTSDFVSKNALEQRLLTPNIIRYVFISLHCNPGISAESEEWENYLPTHVVSKKIRCAFSWEGYLSQPRTDIFFSPMQVADAHKEQKILVGPPADEVVRICPEAGGWKTCPTGWDTP